MQRQAGAARDSEDLDHRLEAEEEEMKEVGFTSGEHKIQDALHQR